ncbi:hypothetical protein M514_12619 [Trichuris suis]|uniref:Uncharacterized protein n=1 Tax=Trichuris suis TaxID=68888 RepID=A0A085NH97_9BILA|nr:hypothetical protein M513_12619 [Trichuris suis]KFD68843.1 hypothetical protein M514_12619 [Trichuris suis]
MKSKYLQSESARMMPHRTIVCIVFPYAASTASINCRYFPPLSFTSLTMAKNSLGASFAAWIGFSLLIILENNVCEVNAVLEHFDFELPGHLKRPKPFKVHPVERSWGVVSPSYKPTPWDAPCMAKQCDQTPGPFNRLEYNLYDEYIDRKRTMCCCKEHHYQMRDGLPANPAGRTGLSGRGLFPRYGPNHYMKILIVKTLEDGYHMLTRNGSEDINDAFFEGFVDHPKDVFYPDELHSVLYFNLRGEYRDDKKVERIMKKGRKNSVRVLSGSVPSYLNTDNAWVEGHIYVLFCEKARGLCEYGLRTLQADKGYTWVPWNRDASIATIKRITKSLPEDDETKKELSSYSIFCEGCDPSLKYPILGMLGIAGLNAAILGVKFGVTAILYSNFLISLLTPIVTPLIVVIAAVCIYDFVQRVRQQ